jgi:hypothetical protein
MHARRLIGCLMFAMVAPFTNAADRPFTQDEARDIIRQLQKVVSPHG